MTVRRIAAALAVLGFGVLAPGLAGLLAVAAALAVVAFGGLLALGERQILPGPPVTPFGPDVSDESRERETPDVAELVRELATARRGIPTRTAGHLREVARGRLLDGRRLDLADPVDRDRAAQLMSAEMRAVVIEDRSAEVSIRELGVLLDELERW